MILNILVTGSSGFIGKNLISTLNASDKYTVLKYDVDSDFRSLEDYVKIADFVVHLAGINRPQNTEEFFTGNKGFTEILLELMEKNNRNIPLLVSSSIQAELDNPYGISKKQAEDAVFTWSERTGNSNYIYRFPNVFGKWCRPNYNSVVATFCNNIARDLPIQVNNPDAGLTLVYIDDVVAEIIKAIEGKPLENDGRYYRIPKTFSSTVGELAGKIRAFRESRKSLILPDFEDEFDRDLYATFLSYLDENDFGYELDMKLDNRGWLAEFIKSQQFGQIFISRTKPGITRGNHWHHTKVEKFLVIQGEAVIRFRQIHGDKVLEYNVSGSALKVLDIPAGYTHSITNTGNEDVITLFWSIELFNKDKPDTYFLEV